MRTLSLSAARARAQIVLAPFVALPAILLLTALVYLPSLDDWFVFHDFIHMGAAAAHSAGDYVQRVLDPGDGGESMFGTGKLYRPVYYLAMLGEQRVFGLDPFPYHLVNLSLHLLNVVLVWLIARKLTRNTPASYVAALVYGLHPVYYEAPAWISAITEVLLATFSFSAIYLFMRSLEERGVLSGLLCAGSFACAVLALGSREPGVSIFLVLPAYYFLVHAPHDWRRWQAWLRFIPFFVVLAIYALLRLSISRAVGSGEGEVGVGSLGWHMFPNIFWFNGRALVPIFTSLGPWLPVVAGFAAIALMRVHEEFFFRGGRAGRFVVAWWYLALIPYSTADWIQWLTVGRYMYMASGAFAILSGMFLVRLVDAVPRWLEAVPWWRPSLGLAVRAAAPVLVVMAVVPFLAWGTLHHQGTFSEWPGDSEALVTQLQETYPSLPAGSNLYVVDPPRALFFADSALYLAPAVHWFYPEVDGVRNVTGSEYEEIAPTLAGNDFVFFYRP